MKKVYSYALAILIMSIVFSCKKHRDTKTPSPELTGYWELVETSGSMPPKTYPEGNGNILVLNGISYLSYQNGQLVKTGNYTTMDDNTVEENICLIVPDDQFTRRIVFDTAYSATKKFYNIADDKLSITFGCYALDGGQKLTYRRMQPITID